MATINHPGGSSDNSFFNAGDVAANVENKKHKHSTKGGKDKGVQYLVLSVVGYVCASVVFGLLLNKKGKESNV